MPIRDEPWPSGTPCWIDLQADDLTAAREFYNALFGWQVEDGPAEAGGYLMAMLDGRPVAGIGPKPGPMPTVWSTYLATDDVDTTLARAEAAGGAFMMPAFDVLDVGRMTFGTDPAGAAYGLWQAKAHTGVGRYNEPGALCWDELHTRDYVTAQAFYAKVFDWTYNEIGDGDAFTYSVIRRADGSDVGGMHLDTMMPEGMPNYWLVWFTVDGLDTALGKAVELGSQTLMGPMDSPFGRMACVAGAQGEVFGLIDMNVRQAAGQA